MTKSTLRVFAFQVCAAFLTGLPCLAQITDVTNNTSTPVPGSGHNYIQMLNETVNPANGAVSVRIDAGVPKARGFTLPFGFAYDSNGPNFVINTGVTGGRWISNIGYLSRGGWSYSVPMLSLVPTSQTFGCDPDGQNCVTCGYNTSYVFQDSSGSRHALFMASLGQGQDFRCAQQFPGLLGGGDDFVNSNMDQFGSAVNIFDLDGTYYNYDGLHHQSVPNSLAVYSLPTFIEDRNGNKITFNDSGNGAFSVVDAVGRTAFSSSGFGSSGNTVSVSGLSPYTLSWGTASSNFTLGFTAVPGSTCFNNGNGFPSQHSESQPVITAITLPNGQQYQFSYETTYGLLSQITYPTGGYVKYSWDINPQSEYGQYTFTNSNGTVNGVNDCIIDWFAVSHRYVSFDGTNIALQQDFSYSPTTWNGVNWTSKQTTVTTHDLVRGTSFVTTYVYSPAGVPSNDPYSGFPGAEVPLEQTITYKDTAGQTLHTVSKQWADMYLLQSEQVTVDNVSVSKKTYKYFQLAAGIFYALPIETDEYDYGSGSPGPLLRKTITNYASFPNTPFGGAILDRPCQIITYDGSNTRVAEQDLLYDGGSSTCGSPGAPSVTGVPNLPSGTHDEVNYSSSSAAPRGNLTKQIRKCLSCTDAITTMTFDETGQVLISNDPNGNHTQYSYLDNYDSGPTSNTNAYITKITYPQTNGVDHIETFQYAFSDGQLIKHIDQNNQPTSYAYNDALRRLTEVDAPDMGKTSYDYHSDSLPPTVTKTVVATPDPSIIRSTIYDGMGHVHKISLDSDPQGPVFVRTDHDGLGREFKVWNPTRCDPDTSSSCPSESTWGITQDDYDSVGRITKTTRPDNSIATVSYSGSCSTSTDESGKQRKGCSDGLGRLTKVFEDPVVLNYETDYQYDALGNLLSVNQKGDASQAARVRTFAYDSLSRLLCSANPEIGGSASCPNPDNGAYTPGTIRYSYDANGNVLTRQAPAPNQTGTATVVTCFGTWNGTSCDGKGYDALNRLTLKSYSVGTLNAQFFYDQGANGVGRLTGTWDGGNTGTNYSYDPMGRTATTQDCAQPVCNTSFWTTYTYDLAGDITAYTIPNTASPSAPPSSNVALNQSIDSAGRVTQLTSSLSDSQHPGTLATVDSTAGFYPTGATRKVTYGNTLTETAAYNVRLQPCRANVNSSGGALLNCNDATPTGTVQDFTYGFNVGASDNGNLTTFTALGNQVFNRTYSYDALNRLKTMSAPGDACSGLSWTIDAWGNRTDQTITGGSCFPFHQLVNSQNRLSNSKYQYDAAGNLINDGSHSYTYDAENRIVQVDVGATASYGYDPTGRRVSKTVGGTTTGYVYDVSGDVLFETQGTSWVTGYLYFGGSLLAQYKNGTTSFLHRDHLGSTRLLTAAGPSTRIQSTGGTSVTKYCIDLGTSVSGQVYTVSAWIKNQGTAPVQIAANIGSPVTVAAGTTQFVNFNATGIAGWDVTFFFNTVNVGDPIDVLAYAPSVTSGGGNMIPVANQNFSGWMTFDGSQVTVTQGQTPMIVDSMDYQPYGEQIAGDTSTTHKFTGKERDSESGLDNFGARYFGSSLGRFMTPDWSDDPDPVPYADLQNPQTLNLYGYLQNNPLSGRDATGHYHCDPDKVTFENGGATVTAGKCYFDQSDFGSFSAFMSAVGHHYIPKAVWQDLNKTSRSWKFLNKLTTRALKNPRLSNSYDRLHRGLNRQMRDLVEDFEKELGKGIKDFNRGDWEKLGERIENAGGDIQKFSERLGNLEPEARSFAESMTETLEELFPAAAEAVADTAVTAGAIMETVPEVIPEIPIPPLE